MPSRCFGFSHNPNWRYIVTFASQRRSARTGSHHGGAKKRSLSSPILFARQPETKPSSGRQAPCLLQRVPCRRFRYLAAGTQGDLAGRWRSFARPRPASTSHRDLRRRRASNGTGHRPPGQNDAGRHASKNGSSAANRVRMVQRIWKRTVRWRCTVETFGLQKGDGRMGKPKASRSPRGLRNYAEGL